jgi:riboflavin kinase/FMN adenylyltransferase
MRTNSIPRGSCVAIGVFDGVHLGHRALLRKTVEEARKRGVPSGVVTFEPHPRKVLSPDKAPCLLTSLEDRLSLFEAAGVENCLVLPFDEALARVEPEDFAREYLQGKLEVRAVFVGFNFTFGRGGRGTAELLSRLGAELGFGVEILPPVQVEGEVVSSSLVRYLLAGGEVERAARALGRPYCVRGRVVAGEGRGRSLGYPTANLEVGEYCLPGPGVYGVGVEVRGRLHPGAANVGFRPTFHPRPRELVLEVHLLDFEEEVRGEELRVYFVKKIREEEAFPDGEALRVRIGRDVEEIRSLWSKEGSLWRAR